MAHYDTIIIGGGVAALSGASYLTRRMRKVALFVLDSDTRVMQMSHVFNDSEKHTYRFDVPYHELGGLDQDEMLSFYFNRLGISEKLKVKENLEATIIQKDGRTVSRPNNLHGFKLYLIRHYPKSKDTIHRFFKEVYTHFDDYKTQKKNRLQGKTYTVNSLLAEWGMLSLHDVLSKYFKNERIMREFSYMHHTVGLDLKRVSAYNYFIRWFNVFVEKSYYIQNTYKELNTLLTRSLKPDQIVKGQLIDYLDVENRQIKAMVMKDGTRHTADYYCINRDAVSFIDQYVKQNKGIILGAMDSVLKEPVDMQYKNVAMIGLSTKPEMAGIEQMQYMFEGDESDAVRLLNLINIGALDAQAAPKGHGALLVEFIDDGTIKNYDILKTLSKYFVDIESFVSIIRLSERRPYRGAHKQDKSTMSMTKCYAEDHYKHLLAFDNGYFIGSPTRPESGATGLIQLGVEIGDLIDHQLDYKESHISDMTHDTLINIIAHQFKDDVLGHQPIVISFNIGKRIYTFRVRGKQLDIYRGENKTPDIVIKTTNETMYKLTTQSMTLSVALKENRLEYEGDEKLLKAVFEAFNLGVSRSFKTYEKHAKPYGLMWFYASVSLFCLYALLSFYIDLRILLPIFLFLYVSKTVGQYLHVKILTPYDVFLFIVFTISLIVRFAIGRSDMLNIEWFLGLTAIYWFFMWGIKKPIINDYIHKDYQADYAQTAFFKTMTAGLSFIWGLAIMILAMTSAWLIDANRLLGFYVIIMAFYLTFKYPNIYIRSTIKDRR